MTIHLKQTFEAVIKTDLYPRYQKNVCLLSTNESLKVLQTENINLSTLKASLIILVISCLIMAVLIALIV